MVWNKAVFCLEVLIYKCLQIWRHNYVIGRNEYLISTLSESAVPWVYSLQFLFKSIHHSWTYKRNCEWVFFSEHSVYRTENILTRFQDVPNWMIKRKSQSVVGHKTSREHKCVACALTGQQAISIANRSSIKSLRTESGNQRQRQRHSADATGRSLHKWASGRAADVKSPISRLWPSNIWIFRVTIGAGVLNNVLTTHGSRRALSPRNSPYKLSA